MHNRIGDNVKKPEKINPQRLCKVIEALCSFVGETLQETLRSKFANEIYRIAHLRGSCQNTHEDWKEEFLKLESQLKKGHII
jgi:hypothetical protein